ncbi:hypothetical protein ACFVVL_21345 [Kitasatospora sp. NPDC058115]|uniref:hypothetical protein n=1 Tax=Kitasatospora sp. NPDC058115 TaxID=3346347 RepID=UPI0036D794C5
MGGDREFGSGNSGSSGGSGTAAGRWAFAARWAVVVAAATASAVVLATSADDGGRALPVTVGGTTTGPVRAPVAAVTTAVETAGAAARPPRREVSPGTTPADPGEGAAVGVAYALDWNTRCETGHLRFAGHSWRTGRPPVLPPGLPGAWGPGSAPPVLPGWATLTAADRLRFDAPGYLDGPVLLEPAAEPGICE